MPLNEMLDKSGWRGRILESRLAPWTKEGVVFGIPHDVHPVSISYRKDLFDEAGIDLASSKTWHEFQDNCLKFQAYWKSRGYPLRHAMELPTTASDYLVVMLLQRHINILDDHNKIHFTDPNVAETIAFYAQLVAGDRAIATDATPGGNLWARDFAQGDLCAVVTPDWRAGYLRRYASQEIAGKVAMMALPKFDDDDAPTGSWGGTMAGIPRRCRDPHAAFDLIMFLYSSKQGVVARWRDTMILPSVKDLWDEPIFHEPDPYYGGQRTGELYVNLARQMPLRYVTPFTNIANAQLSNLLARAVRRMEDGATTERLVPEIRGWLVDATAELERRIKFGKFEDDGARE
jgi:arabinosaccharide transport system substrate-binding protein